MTITSDQDRNHMARIANSYLLKQTRETDMSDDLHVMHVYDSKQPWESPPNIETFRQTVLYQNSNRKSPSRWRAIANQVSSAIKGEKVDLGEGEGEMNAHEFLQASEALKDEYRDLQEIIRHRDPVFESVLSWMVERLEEKAKSEGLNVMVVSDSGQSTGSFAQGKRSRPCMLISQQRSSAPLIRSAHLTSCPTLSGEGLSAPMDPSTPQLVAGVLRAQRRGGSESDNDIGGVFGDVNRAITALIRGTQREPMGSGESEGLPDLGADRRISMPHAIFQKLRALQRTRQVSAAFGPLLEKQRYFPNLHSTGGLSSVYKGVETIYSNREELENLPDQGSKVKVGLDALEKIFSSLQRNYKPDGDEEDYDEALELVYNKDDGQ